jgi:hypothetical protein
MGDAHMRCKYWTFLMFMMMVADHTGRAVYDTNCLCWVGIPLKARMSVCVYSVFVLVCV